MYDITTQQLLNKLTTNKSYNYNDILSLLQYIQQNNIYLPYIVVKYGYILINKYKSHLNEILYYDIIEYICYNAIYIHNESITSQLLTLLINKFTNQSQRLNKLIGLHYETRGLYDKAMNIYKQCLSIDPSNLWFIKRISNISYYNDNIQETVKTLNSYVKQNNNDETVWLQLVNLYLSMTHNNDSKAIHYYTLSQYCCEELILFAAENYLYHLLYADILYSLGQYKSARQYYTQTIELNPSSVRSLYGLLVTIRNNTNDRNDTTIALYKLALHRLTQYYKQNANSNMLEIMLKTFHTL